MTSEDGDEDGVPPRPPAHGRQQDSLKPVGNHVETPGVKPCPFCAAELRDSVIRCTRCGRSLVAEEPRRETGPVAAAPAAAARATWPAPAPTPRPTLAPAASPRTGTATTRPVALRALPVERRRTQRVDVALLFAALSAGAAALLAWQAAREPWVALTITDTRETVETLVVGRVELLGEGAFVGVLGRVVAAVVGAYAVAWLYYGFDRGTTIPWFLSPPIPILAVAAGIFGVVLSATVWLVWKDAVLEHPRALGLSLRELRELLDTQPPPAVVVGRLPGLIRFAGAMAAALAAGLLAWWSARKRS